MNTKTALSRLLNAASGSEPDKDRPPRVAEPTIASPTPMARQRSEAAAQAKQDYLDMEMEVNTLRGELGAAQARITLLTDAKEILHEDIARLKDEHVDKMDRLTFALDRLREENSAINANLETVATILLGIKDRPRPASSAPVSEYAPKPKAAPDDRTDQAGRAFAQGDLGSGDDG